MQNISRAASTTPSSIPRAASPADTRTSSSDRADSYRADWRPATDRIASQAQLPLRDSPPAPTDRALPDASPALAASATIGAQSRSLLTLPAVTPSQGPALARMSANDVSDAAQVHTNALLAADVYNDVPSPPAGYRAASDADLDRLGLDAHMLEQPGETSFRARVYVTGEPGQERYTVAFRGSQSADDWKSNAQQGLGQDSVHYAAALEIGKKLARSDADVTLVGHSLGGGLAAEAAIASGRSADTFNAAGLHPVTIASAQMVAEANGRGVPSVDNYRVPGEILTAVQEGGDRVVGAGLGGLFGGGGAVAGAILVDLPPAFGAQHDLPSVRPEGASWLDSINPVDRHGMDWVLAGTAAQAAR